MSFPHSASHVCLEQGQTQSIQIPIHCPSNDEPHFCPHWPTGTGYSLMSSECLCLLIHVLKSKPLKVMLMEVGVFGQWLHHGAVINEVSGLTKETPENFLVLSTTWGSSRKLPAVNQEGSPPLTTLTPWSQTSNLQNGEKFPLLISH